MIIEEYDESLFISRFEDYKRVETLENPNGNFTYKGLRALFEWLEEITDEENPYKLDVIALCCEYSEYKNLEEYIKDYNTDIEKKDYIDEETNEFNEEEYNQAIEEEINDKTTLIKFEEDINEGFIIGQF